MPILRSLPLKRLKEYLAAYDIPCVGPKEKEDFVQAIAKARDPVTGALSPQAEVRFQICICALPLNHLRAIIDGEAFQRMDSYPVPRQRLLHDPPQDKPLDHLPTEHIDRHLLHISKLDRLHPINIDHLMSINIDRLRQ